jgi:hypothetical protein
MTRYYVHYESTMDEGPDAGRTVHMIMPVLAELEHKAIARCKKERPGSFGHWVNRLANEAA